MDQVIEEVAGPYHACQKAAKTPPSLQHASYAWSWPGGLWKRPHLVFAGPYLGKMFPVLVDAYSKYKDKY